MGINVPRDAGEPREPREARDAREGRERVRGRFLFALATAAYFAITAYFADRKLLWFDELFTVFIARQPDLPRFLAALTQGGDLLPPGIHTLTRAAIATLGDHPVSLRLPSMVGYWLMLAGVYAFVRHRCSAAAAWAATLLPLASAAYWYGFEARPYGVVAGAAMWALVAWQRSARPGNLRWLLLLVVAIASALLLHWHAVLLVAIVGVAEVVRWREERRARVGVLAAVAVSCLIAAPVLFAFLGHSLEFRGLIDPPEPVSFIFHSYELLLGGFAPFLMLLVALSVHTRGFAPANDDALATHEPRGTMPTSEWVAAALFALLPFLVLLLAWVTGGQALPRYGVPAILGCAVLVGFTAERFVGTNRRAAVAWVAVMAAAAVSNLTVQKLHTPDRDNVSRGDREFSVLGWLDRDPQRADVVVPDGLAFITLAYYGPDTRSRLVHAHDPKNLGSRALSELASHVPIRVAELESIGDAGDWVRVYDLGLESPLLARLAASGVVIRLAPGPASASAYSRIFEVRRPMIAPAGEAP